jgi:hypothetical protein
MSIPRFLLLGLAASFTTGPILKEVGNIPSLEQYLEKQEQAP